jgi:hypothetical protein
VQGLEEVTRPSVPYKRRQVFGTMLLIAMLMCDKNMDDSVSMQTACSVQDIKNVRNFDSARMIHPVKLPHFH